MKSIQIILETKLYKDFKTACIREKKPMTESIREHVKRVVAEHHNQLNLFRKGGKSKK